MPHWHWQAQAELEPGQGGPPGRAPGLSYYHGRSHQAPTRTAGRASGLPCGASLTRSELEPPDRLPGGLPVTVPPLTVTRRAAARHGTSDILTRSELEPPHRLLLTRPDTVPVTVTSLRLTRPWASGGPSLVGSR